MSVRAVCTAILMMALFVVSSAYAQQEAGYVQQFENGSIDWSNGKVTAKGIGAATGQCDQCGASPCHGVTGSYCRCTGEICWSFSKAFRLIQPPMFRTI